MGATASCFNGDCTSDSTEVESKPTDANAEEEIQRRSSFSSREPDSEPEEDRDKPQTFSLRRSIIGHMDSIGKSMRSSLRFSFGQEDKGRLSASEAVKLLRIPGKFMAILDHFIQKAMLNYYDIDDVTLLEDSEMRSKIHEMRARIMEERSFDNDAVAGCFVSEDALTREVSGVQTATYLLEKRILPFLTMEWELQEETNGVQLFKVQKLDEVLAKAEENGVFGIRARNYIKEPNPAGIRAIVDQQFELALKVLERGMIPVIHSEVDLHAPEKEKCEKMLNELFMEKADQLDDNQYIMFSVSIPKLANTYLQLLLHPNVLRVMGSTTSQPGWGFDRADSCKFLSENVRLTACFGNAIVEGLSHNQSDHEFADTLQSNCQVICECCAQAPLREEQLAQCAQSGFIVNFNRIATDAVPLLEAYGVKATEGDLLEHIQDFLVRMLTNSSFVKARIIGALFNQHTMINMSIEDKPIAKYLSEDVRVTPILKLDPGFQPISQGVELMNEIPNLEELFDRASEEGVFAVMIPCRVKQANAAGIKKACEHLFNFRSYITDKGLMPYFQISVDMNTPNRAVCESMLFDQLILQFGNLKDDEQVMLDLTLPVVPNVYLPIIQHPKTVRVTGKSDGLGLETACKLVSQNFALTGCFGSAFFEGLHISQSHGEYTDILAKTCRAVYEASSCVPIRELQTLKVSGTNGFFVALDQSVSQAPKLLHRYMPNAPATKDIALLKQRLKDMRFRILKNCALNGSSTAAVSIAEDMVNMELEGLPLPKYLWEVKQTVPMLKIDKGNLPEQDGVQLMKEIHALDDTLTAAVAAGIFGIKMRSNIKLPDKKGITKVVAQQCSIGEKVMAKGLVPVHQIEVDISSPQKVDCERLLLLELLEALGKLKTSEKVILWLTLPSKANIYLPLIGHPNVIRVVALSGGYSQEVACKMLSENIGMFAGFGRPIIEKLSVDQSDEEFTRTLDQACKAMFELSRAPTACDEQRAKIADQDGFVISMDQGAGTRDMLKAYGVDIFYSTSENAIMDKAHQMRVRIMTNPKIHGARIVAAILQEDTMARQVRGMQTCKYLWEQKRIVPILKIDRGLSAEKDGVRLMKDPKHLLATLSRAATFGCFGIKMRSLIRLPNAEGIMTAVDQQFELARKAWELDLTPVMQLEVDTASPDQASCERVLRQTLLTRVKQLKDGENVIFAFRLPAAEGFYRIFSQHEKVLRVLAISSGIARETCCKMLAENAGMTAFFGRAFLEGLNASQNDKDFTITLESSIDSIFKASYQSKKAIAESSTCSKHFSRTPSETLQDTPSEAANGG